MIVDLTAFYVCAGLFMIFALLLMLRIFVQHSWGSCKSSHSLKGKTFIITGANSGIGFETAKGLWNRGARVVFACRNIDKANEAIAKIRKSNKNTGGEMISMQVDLASLESIRAFAETVKVAFDRVDVLINSAGVAVPTRLGLKTQDGFEINMGINHLGHFLLTNLLLEYLECAAPSRVVIVSSKLYKDGKIDLNDLNLTSKLEEIQKSGRGKEDPGYAASKLMNIYFGKALAERTKDMGIDVFILCPGFSYSKLFRYTLKWFHLLVLSPILFFVMKTTKQGAQTVLYCATETSLVGKSGCFFSNCKSAELEIQYDKELEDKLWTASENFVNGEMA